METRITFEISGEQYTMFVEGILKKKYYLSKENKGKCAGRPDSGKSYSQHNERSNYVLAGMLAVAALIISGVALIIRLL